MAGIVVLYVVTSDAARSCSRSALLYPLQTSAKSGEGVTEFFTVIAKCLPLETASTRTRAAPKGVDLSRPSRQAPAPSNNGCPC
ncbi:hypothetical protein V1515DRAFT_598220 [Lipomyces mesembrius]